MSLLSTVFLEAVAKDEVRNSNAHPSSENRNQKLNSIGPNG